MVGRLSSNSPSCDGWNLSEASERNDGLDQHAVEPALVEDARRRVAVVRLVHIFGLEQHVRGDEPATTELQPLDGDVAPRADQLAVDLGKAGTDVELFLREKTIQRLAAYLAPRGVVVRAMAAPGYERKQPEEFQAMVPEVRLDHRGGDAVRNVGRYAPRSEIRRGRCRLILKDEIVARAGPVAIV